MKHDMHILDWRPPIERWLARPSTSASACQSASTASAMAGRLADVIADRRAARRRPPPQDVLVVSVGNLRVGGTGKTPVVLALARDLEARGVRGAVLLRGYGSSLKGPLLVEPDNQRASDEARLLAAALAPGGWLVMQARRRQEGMAQLLQSAPRLDLVLLEDGFQTADVGRHLDVLILDAWTEQGGRLEAATGAVLPFGPYRETARGAERAHVWLLEADRLPLAPAAPGTMPWPVVHGFRRHHVLQAGNKGNQSLTPLEPAPQTWGLLAGLARPEGFEAAALSLLDANPILAVRCGDHCAYDQRLVARILEAGAQKGVTAWVTTQKDWIKLRYLWPAHLSAHLVLQTVAWVGEQTLPDLIVERLASLVRKG